MLSTLWLGLLLWHGFDFGLELLHVAEAAPCASAPQKPSAMQNKNGERGQEPSRTEVGEVGATHQQKARHLTCLNLTCMSPDLHTSSPRKELAPHFLEKYTKAQKG